MERFLISQMIRLLVGVLLITPAITACDDDDPSGPGLTGNSEVYTLFSRSDPGISGTITFAERSDGITVITIDLNGTQAGSDHPSHIHANTAAEGGGIVLDLNNVEGSSGTSETEVSALNDGTPVSYNDLIDFDGYVNVHLSATDLGTLVAQGDIGQNELTGTSENYELFSRSDPNISGTATFSERANGETLVTLDLSGTATGGDHPSHIHANTAAEGGGILISLNNVNGETGISLTNITALDDGTAVTYSQMVDFNGYVNVHLSGSELSTLIAQGDVGQNALTGASQEFTLNSVSVPSISGTATFAERNNGFTLVTVVLSGTTPGGDHPSHIHENDAATGGGIAVSLSNVDGATGVGATSVSMLDDGTAITYQELIEFNGHINVHLSASELSTLIAQGDIGSNSN